MGLDLSTENEDVRIGYIGIHFVRRNWIEAFIKHLEETKKHKKLLKILKDTIDRDKNPYCPAGINYQLFLSILDHKKTDYNIFKGLDNFVTHSDCDGIWKPEEVKEMMETFNVIKPFLDKDRFKDDKYFLEDLFNDAIKSNCNIEFS